MNPFTDNRQQSAGVQNESQFLKSVYQELHKMRGEVRTVQAQQNVLEVRCTNLMELLASRCPGIIREGQLGPGGSQEVLQGDHIDSNRVKIEPNDAATAETVIAAKTSTIDPSLPSTSAQKVETSEQKQPKNETQILSLPVQSLVTKPEIVLLNTVENNRSSLSETPKAPTFFKDGWVKKEYVLANQNAMQTSKSSIATITSLSETIPTDFSIGNDTQEEAEQRNNAPPVELPPPSPAKRPRGRPRKNSSSIVSPPGTSSTGGSPVGVNNSAENKAKRPRPNYDHFFDKSFSYF